MSRAKSDALEVYSKGYVSGVTGAELLKRLTKVYNVLSEQEQVEPDQLPAGLDNVAAQMIARHILASSSKVS